MIDVPESDIRQKPAPIGLVRFVNVLRGKKIRNTTNSESRYGSKKVVDKNTKNTDDTNVEAVDDDEEIVNYKVGRLVMSILKEFQVSTLLEKFEKVLVENVNIDEEDLEKRNSSRIEIDTSIDDLHTISSNEKAYSKKKKSNYVNHRGNHFFDNIYPWRNMFIHFSIKEKLICDMFLFIASNSKLDHATDLFPELRHETGATMIEDDNSLPDGIRKIPPYALRYGILG